MTRTFFVTGTDTGVGKTTVTCALVRALAAAGYRAQAIKPIETGCAVHPDGELLPADALAHRAASGFVELPLEHFIRYRLHEPLAPAVAAERAGVELDFGACLAFVRAAQGETDLLLVEGAGGLLVPFTGTAQQGYQTVADFIVALGVPVLVVARARLGTLNHVFLTCAELERRGVVCAGVILNDVDGEAGLEREDNARVLRASGIPVLAELPYGTAHLALHLSDVVRCMTGDFPQERS